MICTKYELPKLKTDVYLFFSPPLLNISCFFIFVYFFGNCLLLRFAPCYLFCFCQMEEFVFSKEDFEGDEDILDGPGPGMEELDLGF